MGVLYEGIEVEWLSPSSYLLPLGFIKSTLKDMCKFHHSVCSLLFEYVLKAEVSGVRRKKIIFEGRIRHRKERED